MGDERRQVVLGYVLAFANPTLGISLLGSPKEILDALRERNVNPTTFADHADTVIDATDVRRPSPRHTFHGGLHAETFAELLESVVESDLARASALLKGDPGALASGDSGAAEPLLAAVSVGHAGMVELLLAAGAPVDGAGYFAMTPLHWAGALGAADLAARLLDAGADARVESWFLVTADELAALNGHEAVARAIAERASLPPTRISVHRVLERMRRTALAS